MPAEVIELGAHDNMSPAECLDYVHRRAADYQDVLVIGYDEEGSLLINSSHLSKEQANWLIDAAKMHIFTTPMLAIFKEEEQLA